MNKWVGKSIPLNSGLHKATGEVMYLDDIEFPGMLTGKILRSEIAFGKILRIDTSKALAMPGVKAVVTHENTSPVLYNGLVRSINDDWPAQETIFNEIIRQYGQPIAAVAAETEKQAVAALKQIVVEVEEWDPVLDLEEAYSNKIKVYEEGNRLPETVKEVGDIEQALADADEIIRTRLDTPMVHHMAIEPHVCVADWDKEDKLTVYVPHQGVFGAQIGLAKIFNKPYSDIRVVHSLMGGAFGVKVGIIIEPICAELSKQARRPVKIRLTRKECMVGTWTRHSARLYLEAAIKNGEIIGMNIREYLNAGPTCGGTHFIPVAQSAKLFKLYGFPAMKFYASPVNTNTVQQGAMRGFGSPKLFTSLEIMMDQVARKLGVDRVEFRQRYLLNPYDPNPLSEIDLISNARSKDCLQKGKELFGWDEKREEDETYWYGNGVGMGLHGNGVAPHAPDITGMTLKLNEDGSYNLATAICDHGGGSYTVIAQIIAEILSISPDSIRIKKPDTENTPYDLGAYGSRNTWVGGNCAIEVATVMKEKLFHYASQYFGCSDSELLLEDNTFYAHDRKESVSVRDLNNYVLYTFKEKLIATEYFSSKHNAGSYGAHFAKVRIHKETKKIEVIKYVAVADVGTAINPKLVEGQLQGGIQMGLGYALSEELLLNERGKPLNANLKKYHAFHADEMPDDLTVHILDSHEDYGPYGGKSIGEAATVPVAAAVVSAISHALDGLLIERIPVTSSYLEKSLANHQ